MSDRKLRVIASALAVISSAYIPALSQNQAPSLQGHTNGTIGAKGAVERPLETSLRTTAGESVFSSKSSTQRKERPGLVAWHHNFKEACVASVSSGKPVLLVHVLGNLDDHFC